ncbi:hypothetical protein QZH41_017928, partial [Actinostola sp. cb2023]
MFLLWGELNIVSGTGSRRYDDITVMHAAGFLEGALTGKLINEHYNNIFGIFFKSENDTLLNKVAKFFQMQDIWMRTMIAKNSNDSAFWRQMGNILAQYDGLVSGYHTYPPTDKILPVLAFQILNGAGDLIDLQHALDPKRVPDWDHMTKDQILTKVFTKGHCSALIKVLPAYENIFASHASWFVYSAMLRIYKHYYFNLKDSSTGTYNNQYMILDLKLVELNKTLHDNALWVVEQIPTYVASGDQTEILRLGYWPSYNVPFYEKVYNLSGYPEFVEKHGTSYSYQLAPRAKIFRRDQATVHDMDTMKHIMRYNDYKHDPYSANNPTNAICARGDLNPDNPLADGCYDAKVTDFFMAQSLVSTAISGPTAQ